MTAGYDFPIFLPLLTYDKEETVALARKIGTFIDAPGDTSCAACPKKTSIAAPKETIDQIVQDHSLNSFVYETLEKKTMIRFENGRQVD